MGTCFHHSPLTDTFEPKSIHELTHPTPSTMKTEAAAFTSKTLGMLPPSIWYKDPRAKSTFYPISMMSTRLDSYGPKVQQDFLSALKNAKKL
jgi:hypothetical protein